MAYCQLAHEIALPGTPLPTNTNDSISFGKLREVVESVVAHLTRVRDQYADLRKMVLALPKVEAVPMTDAGWTRERPTAAGWYWNRISGTAGIALITRRDGRLYVWLKFKDAWLTREGWLDYIHGEWLGPITPDSYARGRVEGLT
jgi:hypothetical protein